MSDIHSYIYLIILKQKYIKGHGKYNIYSFSKRLKWQYDVNNCVFRIKISLKEMKYTFDFVIKVKIE